MASEVLTSEYFIAQVDVLSKPEELAFPHGGNSRVYTGPHPEIYSRYVPVFGVKFWNGQRAAQRSAFDGALLIDNSSAGRYLIDFKTDGMQGKGVYAYFKEIAGLSGVEAAAQGDSVWLHTTELFIRSLFGKVSTTVTGADRARIFYTVEIPYMMAVIPELLRKVQKAKDIDTINEFPTTVIRNTFSMNDFEKAYKYFSLTEQRKVFRCALDGGSKDIYGDYLDTLEMFHLDKRRHGIVGKHPLNTLCAEERMVWKEAEMNRFANRTLKQIDETLGLKPKRIVVMQCLPCGLPKDLK